VTRPLFEQYKDALRRGHVAARAGKLDDALVAYAEAARLAPDRAAPHTSSATVLHRAGRRNEAIAEFERALAIAADDEATLRARAAMFEDLGRLASAAADLEHLAETLDADGRRADALAAARRAVELTATPARRALVEQLEQPEDDSVLRPRPSPTARAAAAAPSKPAPTPPGARPAPVPELAEPSPDAEAPAATGASSTLLMDLYDEPVQPESAAPTPAEPAPAAPPPPASEAVEADVGPMPTAEPEPALTSPQPAAAASSEPAAVPTAPVVAVPPTPEPLPPLLQEPPGHDFAGFGSEILIQLEPDLPAGVSIPWPAIDLPSAPPPPIVGPPPDPDVLMAEALALIDGGDPKSARNLLLTAVAVHRAAGRPDAALDVCLQLLALAPGDAHVHLAIAGLQLDRGWRTLATEKIQLLLRLTALTGDTQAEADAHALAAERLRDEPPSSFARA
jgi:tetratricopeptide (TPR) repeat protein